MSKKKTPQEKKSSAYEKDHYTFAWNSPHGFRKTWKNKKRNVNKVIRRKSKALLHSVEGLSYQDLSSEHETYSDGLFLRGLSKKKLFKRGVVSLKEKVEQKIEKRRDHVGFNARNKARQKESCRLFVQQLLEDKEYSEQRLIQLRRRLSLLDFQTFLESDPQWIPRLKQWIQSASKRIAWEQNKH